MAENKVCEDYDCDLNCNNEYEDRDLMEQLAYFYHVKNPKKVSEHFMNAIKFNGEQMRNNLKLAYEEVKNQTGWDFDVDAATEKELLMIVANREHRPQEETIELMVDLYEIVFGVEREMLRRVSEIRTFLYRLMVLYKDEISENVKTVAKLMAKMSEEDLARFVEMKNANMDST